MKQTNQFTFQEFFAGGGMVRQALSNWDCLFANDFDGKKALIYQDNWGTGGELYVGDIRNVPSHRLAKTSDLAWASFPCQDLSLAGKGSGLKGERSSMFYVFWNKLKQAARDGEMPNLVVIENVCGMLTSNNGEDFRSVVQTFSENGYYVGGLVMDAKDFVPQSRKRVFIIGLRKDKTLDPTLASPLPIPDYHTKSLIRAFETLDSKYKCDWIWYNLAREPHRKSSLIDILEPFGDVDWNSDEKTHSILQKMSVTNFKKIEAAKSLKQPTVGALFMRTRKTKASKRVFAEVRFDGISGCLRTPNGGSSRQSIIWVDGPKITSRLLTPRETARLMGLPESYKLPKNKNAALHLTGDGVVVPVVKHLKDHLFEPLLTQLDYSDVNLDPLYEFA